MAQIMTAPGDAGGVLTLLDVLQIQPFVFASNRLRDIAGGSALVEKASSKHTLQELAKPNGHVVFAAGGNALLEFSDAAGVDAYESAKRFAADYSRCLIEKFPGLRVAIHHQRHEPDGYADAFVRAWRELQARKLGPPAGAPTLGLSVTAECAETRAVATHLFRRPNGRVVPISPSMAARRRRDRGGNGETEEDSPRSRWRTFLPPEFAGVWEGFRLEFPLELDLLGRQSGETSLIGIVHVDGNQVGQRVLRWVQSQRDTESQALREGLQRLTEELAAVVKKAMEAVLARVCGSLDVEADPSGHPVAVVRSRLPGRRFPLAKPDETPGKRPAFGGRSVRYLPVRPVLLGGDDLTFVCDGRIALDLARVALQAFRDTPVPLLDGYIGASAGVAIVKSHSPFARAYQLASALCDNTKRALQAGGAGGPLYGLDWHIGFAPPLEPIDALRKRQYEAGGRELTHRPYPLGRPESGYTFTWLDETVLGAAGDGSKGGFHNPFWSNRRGKVRQLGEIAREGPEAVGAALEAWKVTAGVEALPGELDAVRGFDGRRTPLLDAVELLDVHLPLRP